MSKLNELVEILRRQHEAANWLAAFRLANFRKVINDLSVANSTNARCHEGLARVWGGNALLQTKKGRLSSELALART